MGFIADTAHQANAIAEQANAERASYQPATEIKKGLTPIGALVDDFIVYRERNSPNLRTARSWKNRRYALQKFGREFSMPPSRLTRPAIQAWWDQLTHSQQKLRHAEFRRAFNYWLGRDLFKQLTYNPFTTADDRPRLYSREKPDRARLRLELKQFWAIYQEAGKLGYEGLQIAMGISLLTFMREGDILNLRIDQHINDSILKTVISKSAAQKGHTKATRLQWDNERHTLLRNLTNRGRELSMKNMRSPFLISYISKRRDREYRSKLKIHKGQIPKERFAKQFRDARDATGLWNDIPQNKTPPTFHEIRSLADATAKTAGYKTSQIQLAMAHSDEAQTLQYLANHELPHDDVEVVFTEEMIGGKF